MHRALVARLGFWGVKRKYIFFEPQGLQLLKRGAGFNIGRVLIKGSACFGNKPRETLQLSRPAADPDSETQLP